MSQQYQQRNQSQARPSHNQTTALPPTSPAPPQLLDLLETTDKVNKPIAQDPAQSWYFENLSLEEQFKYLVSSGIKDTITGLVTARQVQQDMRVWFSNLSDTDKATFKITARDLALYLARQVEDVLSEVPVIFM